MNTKKIVTGINGLKYDKIKDDLTIFLQNATFWILESGIRKKMRIRNPGPIPI